MMLHPSYKELMEKVNEGSTDGSPIVHSRYSIVLGTAKRARQITAAEYKKAEKAKKNGEKPPLRDASKKALSIAVDELDNDKIHIISEDSENYESSVADEDGRQ